MIGHIESACFHSSCGRELIYASNRDSEWIRQVEDVKNCYGNLIDKVSGESIVLLSPAKTGMFLIVCKMIPNQFGDNITAYLHIPFGLDVPGAKLKGLVFDVISALAQNRRDSVSSCLGAVSKEEFNLIEGIEAPNVQPGNGYAYRYVNSENGNAPLSMILNNLFQDYYANYKYIFLSIDEQHVANAGQHTDLTDSAVPDWRPVKEEKAAQEIKEEPDNGMPGVDSAAGLSMDNSIDAPAAEPADTPAKQVAEEKTSPIITSEWLKENTNIHGWMSFFLFSISVGGIISAIFPVVTYNSEDYAGNGWLGSVDVITGFMLLAIAGYTVYAFTARKPNAVFWGKVYVVFVFLTNLLSLISGGFEETGFNTASRAIRSLVWGVIWFLYLTYSEQVQEIMPKSFRKISVANWWTLSGIILLPIFLCVMAFTHQFITAYSNEAQEVELMNADLAYNERTDGRVIFTIPGRFECNSEDVDTEGGTLRVFSIDNDEIGNCTLCSDYDSNSTKSNFDSYWTNWKDDEASKYSRTNVDSGCRKINGHDCWYRIIKYDVDGTYVYWRFYLLFDDETGKVLVASFYDQNVSTSYVNELLNSVRFK